MNDFLRLFLVFWLYAIPNFVIILFAKCTDVVSYKNLRMTDKTAKLLFINLFIVEAAHILAAGIESLLVLWWKDTIFSSPLALIPIFTVLPLIILHFIERKYTSPTLSTPTPQKRIVVTNIVQALIFNISYGCFFYWYLVASIEDTFVIMGTVDPKLEKKWNFIFFIGIFALMISFAIIKLVIQTRILKKKSDDSLSQSIENPAK